MRTAYHTELDQLVDQLSILTGLVEVSMSRATTALLAADVPLAERIIGDEPVIDELLRKLDNHAVTLVARQQPVARDLRTIVAALRIAADLGRMARLSVHVAEVARRYPDGAVPTALRDITVHIGDMALSLVSRAKLAIRTRNPAMAEELRHADDEMDRLQEVLYWSLLAGECGYPTSTAIDVALIGRHYERYADHAVALAEHIAYLAGIGELDETHPSRPLAGAAGCA